MGINSASQGTLHTLIHISGNDLGSLEETYKDPERAQDTLHTHINLSSGLNPGVFVPVTPLCHSEDLFLQ